MGNKGILCLIDANLNRLIEGLRVCEEVLRFIVCDKYLTLKFKTLRHKVVSVMKTWGIRRSLLLNSRSSQDDPGRFSIKSELARKDYKNIFFANIQRAKESLRVLEEFAKLDNRKVSVGFKTLRYKLYQLEPKANSRL